MKKTILLVLLLGFFFLGCTESESGSSQNASMAINESTNLTIQPTPIKAKVLFLGSQSEHRFATILGLKSACIDDICPENLLAGRYGDYYFTYYELGSAEDPMPSIIEGLELAQGDYDTVIFLFSEKNFEADSAPEAFEMQRRISEDVYREAVLNRGKKLIIANPPPLPNSRTNPEALSLQAEYNSWLKEFVSNHEDVSLLDLYRPLADSGGTLNPEYAYMDSALDDSAYEVITPKLIALLDKS